MNRNVTLFYKVCRKRATFNVTVTARAGRLGLIQVGALAAGHCGNDAHLVASLQGCAQPPEEAHILAVDVDIHEAADLSALVAQPLPETRVLLLKGLDALAQVGPGHLEAIQASGQGPERGGN